VPRALLLGVTIVTLVYILTTTAFLYLVPLERVTSGEAFAAQAGEALFGRIGGSIFAVVVCIAVLSSLTSYMTAAPRVYYAMARDGIFLKAAGALHPRFGTPVGAILVQASLALVLVGLGSFNQIVGYFLFATVLFVTLTVAAVFRMSRGDSEDDRGRVSAAMPVVFLTFAVLLLILFVRNSPRQALLGTAVVGLGWPVYHLVFRRALPRRAE